MTSRTGGACILHVGCELCLLRVGEHRVDLGLHVGAAGAVRLRGGEDPLDLRLLVCGEVEVREDVRQRLRRLRRRRLRRLRCRELRLLVRRQDLLELLLNIGLGSSLAFRVLQDGSHLGSLLLAQVEAGELAEAARVPGRGIRILARQKAGCVDAKAHCEGSLRFVLAHCSAEAQSVRLFHPSERILDRRWENATNRCGAQKTMSGPSIAG